MALFAPHVKWAGVREAGPRAGAAPGGGVRRGALGCAGAGVRRVPGRSPLRPRRWCSTGSTARRARGAASRVPACASISAAMCASCSPAPSACRRRRRSRTSRRRRSRATLAQGRRPACAKAKRPVLVIGSQVTLAASEVPELARAVGGARRAGVPRRRGARPARRRACAAAPPQAAGGAYAKPIWWSSPASRPTSGSTTAATSAARPTLIAANRDEAGAAQEPQAGAWRCDADPAQFLRGSRTGSRKTGRNRRALEGLARDAAQPATRRASGDRARRRSPARSWSIRSTSAARSTSRWPTTRAGRRRRRLRRDRRLHGRARGRRSPGSTPASSARSAWAAASRSAPRLCRPKAEVWIIYGDGSAAYSLAEFDTFVRHGIPVIAVVGNDAGWTQIAREQVEILGTTTSAASSPAPTITRSPRATAAAAFSSTRNEDIRSVLEEALAIARSGSPVLINAHLAKTEFRKGSISM